MVVMIERAKKPPRSEGPWFCQGLRCRRYRVIAKAENTPIDKVRVPQRTLCLAAKGNR